jgi:ankyrin repeat protein
MEDLSKDEQFMEAVESGDLDLVKKLKNDPAVDVNLEDDNGWTPFHIACFRGHKDVVSLLLADHTVDVNKPEHDEASPFFIACQNGREDVVSLLLADHRVDVNKPRDTGATPFFTACFNGNEDTVSLLLADHRVDVNKADNDGRTPFSVECQLGNRDIVSLLMADHRVDVNKADNDGRTPFYIACQQGHTNIVSLLTADHRIDVNEPQNNGMTPFSVACQFENNAVLELLFEDPRIDTLAFELDTLCTPLWTASHEARYSTVQLMLASGRDLDAATKTAAGTEGWNNTTAAEICQTEHFKSYFDEDVMQARRQFGPLIADLINSYERDPVSTRHQLRCLPEMRDPYIGGLFALVVFLSDDLLTLKADNTSSSSSSSSSNKEDKAKRFFGIARRFPLELQMIVCNRMFGSVKNNVHTSISEPAFKKLTKTLLCNAVQKS